MKLQRIRSIDIFRGLCMTWMILNHLIAWWLNTDYMWIHTMAIMIIDPIGASGFLFISGVSIAISYRRRLNQAKVSENYNYRMLRTSYFFRATFIFLIAIFYNIPITVWFRDIRMVWSWFVLLTAAVSLFLAWPLLKTNKLLRIFIAIVIIILQQFVILWLAPYEGSSNIYGKLFHLLYNPSDQDPILTFFPFFLIGTVIGDMMYDITYGRNKDNDNQNFQFKKKPILYVVIIGIILIISGVLLSFLDFLTITTFFGTFLERQSFSWIIYSLGIDLVLLSILLFIEYSRILKIKKSYKFIFYFSYYSLTIYLAHNIFFFLFFNQLNLFAFNIVAVIMFISIGVLLRAIYNRWEEKVSIKAIVGKVSLYLTLKIEERIKKSENLNKIK
jgi:uncharacterized membrane protein